MYMSPSNKENPYRFRLKEKKIKNWILRFTPKQAVFFLFRKANPSSENSFSFSFIHNYKPSTCHNPKQPIKNLLSPHSDTTHQPQTNFQTSSLIFFLLPRRKMISTFPHQTLAPNNHPNINPK